MKKKKRKLKKKAKQKIIKSIIIGAILLVVLVFSFVIIDYFIFPRIYLKGGNSINIEYKTKYIEKGYSAKQLNKNITNEVRTTGDVNTNKLGKYKIKYKVGSGIFSKTVIRTIIVEDKTKPIIELKKGDIYACPGTEYKPDKIKAIDNYDGDISKKVKSFINKNQVTFTVSDSSGNKRNITKKIQYKDIEKPIIELKGENIYNHCLNYEYIDPGYNVTDNCTKDLINKVQTEGNVDITHLGEYNLIYRVKDESGNEAETERTVRVSEGDYPGTVYLTFDDGPNEGTTNVILDILKEEGVQATFFVTSKGPDDLIVREHNEGHTVALHTSSHDYERIYSSDEAYINDLETISNRVERLTGVKSMFFRFPGGSSNTISKKYSIGIMSRLARELQNRGYKYYDWNISSGDAGSTTDPEQVYRNVVDNLKKERVNMVLMHDIKPYTRDALRNIIHYCKENGYQIRKIDNCTTRVVQRINN